MVEKLAFDLVENTPTSNLTYYADDGAEEDSAPSDDDSFMSLFEDEGEEEHKEPEVALEEGEHEPEMHLTLEHEAPVDTVLTFEDDGHEDDSDEPKAEVELSETEDGKSTKDEDLALDGLMQLGNTMLPGATVQFVAKEEEPDRDTTWEEDGDHAKFIPYMINCLQSVPQHSGQTTVGCEKAITYLRSKDKEISKAVQTDTKNQVDERKAEQLRDIIHNWIERLEAELDAMMGKKKKKKKASFSIGKTVVARINDGLDLQYFVSVTASDGEERLLKVDLEEPEDHQVQAFISGEDKRITKEAGALVTFVDPFLQSITRLLIRAHITQGKDLREVYAQLDAQYKFSAREQLSIHELLLQKGLPLNVDLGRLQEKDATPYDGKNVEFVTEYPV